MKKEYKLFISNNYIYIISNNKLLKYSLNNKEVVINNYLIVNSKLLKYKIKKIINKNLLNTGLLLPNINVYIFKKYPTTVTILTEIFKELNFKNIIIKCVTIPKNYIFLFINNNRLEKIAHNNMFLNTRVLSNNKKYIIIGNRKISSVIERKYHVKVYYYNEISFYKKILS